MKTRQSSVLRPLAPAGFLYLCLSAHGATVNKADNATNLNLSGAWLGDVVPGTADVAEWNSAVTGGNSTILGGNLSWKGLKVVDPGGDVGIGSGSVLTLGSSGIDMSAATRNLAIGSGVTLLQNTSQSWQVGNGVQLTIGGTLTGGGGGVANLSTAGSGLINVSSGTTTSRLSFATLNGVDVAALDASKNVVNATSVFTYVNPAGGNSSGTVVGIDVQTTTAGSTQAYRHSNSLTLTNGVRFNAANTQASSWTVDTSSAGRLGTLPHIIVTSNVGAQDIFYNGSGGLRAGSNGGELYLHQLNTSGRLVFNTTIINNNSASSLTKTGAGTVVIASASGYSGVTRINEGTFQLGNGGTVGSVGSTSIINNGNLSFNRTDTYAAGYVVSGIGSLVHEGTGTLTLTNNSTYTGATLVSAGTLLVNGSLGNTTTVVNGTATLGGTGTLGGSVTVASTAFLAAGDNGIESLGVGSAVINGRLLTQFDGTGAGTIDLLAAAGNLDISNATLDLSLVGGGAALDDAAYVFASYGSLTGAAFSSVLNLPGGYQIDYAFGGNNIALVAVPEPAGVLLGSLGLLAVLRRRRI
ncbi:autotransporter-associated beta strand repeat-containing protein [Luteolibacter yonseiensis]|uniref:Autotransporter-associated beta strand repeat-containing protein n=1 Tax=Luteolibacter yonseiensis TaxID=1144680 RepID=A0A934VEA4_9BACT|nr:autotransporter-associated beta strand repeat-containing protein [Luteolibacter yonseiensis]MBK1818424.1 autotransporter-associated beta strand repeat-containing protein [Luteolibacter yonseiensis]